MQEYIGRSGYLGGYRLLVGGDRVRVLKEDVVILDHQAPPYDSLSIGQFVAQAEDLRLAWGRLPDGDEVIVVSDAAQGTDVGLSYTINIRQEALSGWGRGVGLVAAADAPEPPRGSG